MTHYETLGIPPNATAKEIKTAYRNLVQLFHTDRLQQATPELREFAQERLKGINEAYQVLSDPTRRSQYDAMQVGASATREEPGFSSTQSSASSDAGERASLDEQIARLGAQIQSLTAQRSNLVQQMKAELRRRGRNFWVSVLLTTMGMIVAMMVGIGAFNLLTSSLKAPALMFIPVCLPFAYEIVALLMVARTGGIRSTIFSALAQSFGLIPVAAFAWLLGGCGILMGVIFFRDYTAYICYGAPLLIHLLICLPLGGLLMLWHKNQQALFDRQFTSTLSQLQQELQSHQAKRQAMGY